MRVGFPEKNVVSEMERRTFSPGESRSVGRVTHGEVARSGLVGGNGDPT